MFRYMSEVKEILYYEQNKVVQPEFPNLVSRQRKFNMNFTKGRLQAEPVGRFQDIIHLNLAHRDFKTYTEQTL